MTNRGGEALVDQDRNVDQARKCSVVMKGLCCDHGSNPHQEANKLRRTCAHDTTATAAAAAVAATVQKA